MAKPRTNAETAQYWADSILTNEPADALTVNSVIVRNDTIYSFGSHYPMGKIFRWLDTGKVRRVVVTNDFYPHRGWAKTPEDQSAVESAAREACREAKIELEFAPLSGYKWKAGIPCKPKASDPPLAHPWIEVPRVFHATDPGPEPVKSPEGCVAGRFEEYSYQSEQHLLVDSDARPTDFVHWERIGANYKALKARRAVNGFIYYGVNHDRRPWSAPVDEQWVEFQKAHPGADIHYEQCRHCTAFDSLHREWSARYHGSYGRPPGFKLYSEMIETYGSVQGWREAYRTDWRRVVSGRKYIKAWTERNFIPLSAVSTDADGIPILDENGHAMRKDSEAFFRKQRESERRRRRLEREAEESARIRRHARKLYERRQARLQRRHEESFFGAADRVARELRAMRGLES